MTIWLKSFGTVGNWMDDDWIISDPSLLHSATFPQTPTGIKSGDKLVYYALGHRRVMAIAEVISAPYYAPEVNPAWPGRCDVRMLAIMPFLRNAPLLEDVKVYRDLKLSIRQRSYIRLTGEEYERVVERFLSHSRKLLDS